MSNVNEACATYLKQVPGTDRIMQGLIKKYQSLGCVGGTVMLTNPTIQERVFLRGLLKKDMTYQKSITIALKKFEKSFDGTRFHGVNLGDVLACYTGKTLRSRVEQRHEAQAKKEAFFEEICNDYTHEKVKKWLVDALNNPQSGRTKWLMRWYSEERKTLKTLLFQLEAMVKQAEESQGGVLRPVMASLITKDPHALDGNRPLLKVLEYYLAFAFQTSEPQNAQERTELLKKIKIINDTGACTVATYGLVAKNREGQSMQWESFYQRYEPLTLNLLNLMKVESALPINGTEVYCFENRSMFYRVIQEQPNISAMCSAGQPNLAVYQLLEKIANKNVSVKYHGDFDPEGLLIADKLMQRFTNLTVFDYTIEAYQQAISDKPVGLKRLKQLEALTHPMLIAIGNEIKKHGYAAYEENLQRIGAIWYH